MMVTANMAKMAADQQPTSTNKTHVSIENIPKAIIVGAPGRNHNILSNSLQMLSGSDSIDSCQRSMIYDKSAPG